MRKIKNFFKRLFNPDYSDEIPKSINEIFNIGEYLEQQDMLAVNEFTNNVLNLDLPDNIKIITKSGLYLSYSKAGFFIYFNNVRIFKTNLHHNGYFIEKKGVWEHSGPWIYDAYDEIKDAFNEYQKKEEQRRIDNEREDAERLDVYGDEKETEKIIKKYNNGNIV